MKLKYTLVNPVGLMSPPFGLLYIAGALEAAGQSVGIREMPSPFFVDYNRSLRALVAHLKKEPADVIGITCMAAQRYEVIDIIKALRENHCPGKIVVGGVHASFMPEEVMGWGADYVVMNEGEDTIVELNEVIKGERSPSSVDGIFYREGGAARKSKIRGPIDDLDRLPLPAYHLIDSRRFTARKGMIRGRWFRNGWVLTSRGCPSSCTFCSAHRMFGKHVRYRSIDRIMEEIDILVSRFDIDALVIADDTFTVRKERVLEFCEKIKKRFPGMKWNCQARVNLFDEEIAMVLKGSNCIQVDFGVESGSQKVLDRLKKGIKTEDTVRAFDACRKYGLRTMATIMVGNPDEDNEDIEKTRALLKRIRPSFYAAYYTTPFPGTELHEEAKRDKLIDGSDRYWHQYAEPVMMSKLDRKDMKKALGEFTKLRVSKNYIFNPLFLWDMAVFSALNPMIALRVFCNLLIGRGEKALMLMTNSVYFKRQAG